MPDLSVIVPSVNGFGDLDGCLTALEAQRADVDLEVIVVDRLGADLTSRVRSSFPWARIVEVEPAATIPQMRAVGFAAATAPAIGVIEDHVLVREGWAKQMLAALASGATVVGGPIENAATNTLMDWASFLCEYSHCIPPLPEGRVDWLPGNNVVYTRKVLDANAAIIAEHKWENRLHDAIRDSGTPLVCRPEIVADHKKHFTFGEYMSQRYLYSRSYAGARVRGAPLTKKLAYAVGSLVLPPVLFLRTVSRIRAKDRHQAELKRSLPYIAFFVVAWAAGEFVGYVAGAGDSLSKVT
ncbi:MAG: glycosyltransferase [Longimicrobiales bacterium]